MFQHITNTSVGGGDILASLVGFIQQWSEIQKIFKCHVHILRKILTNTHKFRSDGGINISDYVDCHI